MSISDPRNTTKYLINQADSSLGARASRPLWTFQESRKNTKFKTVRADEQAGGTPALPVRGSRVYPKDRLKSY